MVSKAGSMLLIVGISSLTNVITVPALCAISSETMIKLRCNRSPSAPCLCTKHQNVALTAKSLKKVGIVVDANPERMVKEQNLKDKVREKLDENTPFKHSQWKRVEIEEKGKKKYVTKILETTLAKQKFISIFEQQVVRCNRSPSAPL
jgi:hypothetical protein